MCCWWDSERTYLLPRMFAIIKLEQLPDARMLLIRN